MSDTMCDECYHPKSEHDLTSEYNWCSHKICKEYDNGLDKDGYPHCYEFVDTGIESTEWDKE